jgi:SiaC family regulatory phosphoprotein
MSKDRLIISPTKSTPEVILDPKGTVKLTGRLIPENAEDFFDPIEEWIKEYFYSPAEITCVEISLEYINSVGTKYLLDLIHKITHTYLRKNNKMFIINWYYRDEDEDIFEKGTFFSSNLDIPFNFIKIIWYFFISGWMKAEGRGLRVTYYLEPTAFHLLPSTYCLPPTTFGLS